ncbi:hypothetical protein DERF_002879 [Dermatophagoides farinae]|uniref:Uncharacterized protein n=1 Tax=Dermatophagoides farinae TaxID=6954 RepID=A0A922LAY0_DERFA|nr:hypothetical protein DERF_002879 [Dermatophagoides farinae]
MSHMVQVKCFQPKQNIKHDLMIDMYIEQEDNTQHHTNVGILFHFFFDKFQTNVKQRFDLNTTLMMMNNNNDFDKSLNKKVDFIDIQN